MCVNFVSLLQFVASISLVSDVYTVSVIVNKGFSSLLDAYDLNSEVDSGIGRDRTIIYTTVGIFRWAN